MSFRNFVDVDTTPNEQGQSTVEVEGEQSPKSFTNEVDRDNYYFNIKNPDTGERFDIPLLIKTNPSYYYKYINYMKIRERSPETFATIMNWG